MKLDIKNAIRNTSMGSHPFDLINDLLYIVGEA